jgi:hypothetical protein
MECRVTVADTQTIVEQVNSPFKMSVTKNKIADNEPATALLEATVYKEEGAFVRHCTYLFEALDARNQPLSHVDIDEFKQAVDLYFAEVLATDYYVKSIPRASSLCHREMQKFNF